MSRIMSPIPRWIGSKRLQIKYLLPLVPPHEISCEVFGGAAWLSFNLPTPRRVVNDRDPELVNVYRQIAENGEALARKLYFSISSRHILASVAASRDARPISRAFRFLYINKAGFNGRMHRPTFAVRRKTAKRSIYSFAAFAIHIRDCQSICREIEFDNLDFAEAIARYDSPETFFYIDPPYPGCERYYGPGLFDPTDFKRLALSLATIKGKFLMSLPAKPEVAALFHDYEIREMPVIYMMNNNQKTRAREYVIANYPLPARVGRVDGKAGGEGEKIQGTLSLTPDSPKNLNAKIVPCPGDGSPSMDENTGGGENLTNIETTED